MKIKVTTVMITLFLLINGSVSISAQHDHHQTADHCDNPTAEIKIIAEEALIAFTDDEYQVEKNTCYTLIFENPSTTSHDISIDETDIDDHHFHEVHIHVANSTDGHMNNGMKSMNIMTPDVDTELDIYCSVEGHRSSGMEALLIVGEGNSFIPFNYFYALLGLIFTTYAMKFQKRKNY